MKRSEELQQELKQLEVDEKKFAETVRERFGCRWWESKEASRYYWDNGGTDFMHKKEAIEFDIYRELNREIEVGEGVTYCLWSDKHACTVIARTRCTLTIQRDKAILDPNFKPEWIPGGFAGHCTNQDEQSYTYERDPNGQIYKCRWSEKNGRFQTGSDGSIRIARGRHEFYDYNF